MKRETTPIGAKAPKGKTQTASESTPIPRSETKAPARKRSLPPPEPPLSFAPAPDAPAPADGSDGRIRAVIGAVLPSVDEGRFPVKAIVGQRTTITAHCFTDGLSPQMRATGKHETGIGVDKRRNLHPVVRSQGCFISTQGLFGCLLHLPLLKVRFTQWRKCAAPG